VKDARGLEDSLAKFVKGEHISDYQVTDFSPPPFPDHLRHVLSPSSPLLTCVLLQWDDNGPRVDIVKRYCLSHLSDTVIFHLKARGPTPAPPLAPPLVTVSVVVPLPVYLGSASSSTSTRSGGRK